jgi:DNA-binding response OmpR family regulator
MIQAVSHDEQIRVRTKHVLLIEDREDEVTLFERALRAADLGPRMHVAADVESAETHLFAASDSASSVGKRPDLVILDVKLPRTDGLSLLRRIRSDARLRRTPVIMFTASAEEHDRLRGYALGANSYIQKPTNYAVLEDVVRQVLVYWLVVNTPAPLIMGEFS